MKRRTIALGIDDFKSLRSSNAYYVDKSLFIKDIIEDGAFVTLLPRPRRFGKTLNMTMLKYFLEKTEESHRHLFDGLLVEQYPEVMAHQGQYPVIYMSFKDAKKTTWQESWDIIKKIIILEYKRHIFLLESIVLDKEEKDVFQLIITNQASQRIFEDSLVNLSMYLHRYYKIKPFILLDEYDAPVHAGFAHTYYDEAMNFTRSFLAPAFKGNNDLYKGVLTGILRIVKESIFSGLNNLKVRTLLDQQYSEYFGFLASEVDQMLEHFGPHENDHLLKSWYNGYQMGSHQTVYNPWSVLNYIDNNREFAPYWMRSSNNLLIKEIVQKAPVNFREDLEQLMAGNTVEKSLDDMVTFDEIIQDADVALNFLLLTGYLSFSKKYLKGNRSYLSLVIPNEEVKLFYEDTINAWLSKGIAIKAYQSMLQSLTEGDITLFKTIFTESVQKSMSYFDATGKEPENFYHAFVLGMLVSLQETHQVLSNRESAYGRYDVMVIPRDIKKIGIIIEFKKVDDETDEAFEKAAQDALDQINKKNYKAELESRGITRIINLAIALRGKKVLIKEQI